jgi:hypothetical protein
MYKHLVLPALVTLLAATPAAAGPAHSHGVITYYHSAGHPAALHPAHPHYRVPARWHRNKHYRQPWYGARHRHDIDHRYTVGAFVLGSALTYGLMHEHQGASCRERHEHPAHYAPHR